MGDSIEIVQADTTSAQQYGQEIADLVHATGPVSYDYHFPQRTVFNALIGRSWLAEATLFSADASRLALDGDELLGIEIGFHGPEFRERQKALSPLWHDMLAAGEVSEAQISEVLERSGHASWLNPVVHTGVYYVHALSVKPEARGKKVGMRLLSNAIDRGTNAGHKQLQLDVLSDNPAVNFYQSMGLELLVESRAPRPEQYGVPPEWRMGRGL